MAPTRGNTSGSSGMALHTPGRVAPVRAESQRMGSKSLPPRRRGSDVDGLAASLADELAVGVGGAAGGDGKAQPLTVKYLHELEKTMGLDEAKVCPLLAV